MFQNGLVWLAFPPRLNRIVPNHISIIQWKECREFPVSSWGICFVFPVAGSRCIIFFPFLLPFLTSCLGARLLQTNQGGESQELWTRLHPRLPPLSTTALWSLRLTRKAKRGLREGNNATKSKIQSTKLVKVNFLQGGGQSRLRPSCHAAGGRALGAADAGIGATVLWRGRVGGERLPFCHRAGTSGKICCSWTHI